MSPDLEQLDIPVFDGSAARRGYALNAMCFSLNDAGNRARFMADSEAYFDRYGLDEEQRKAVRDRDMLGMVRVGGNAYYLLKLANIFGMDVQDAGAQQVGVTREQFVSRLRTQGA